MIELFDWHEFTEDYEKAFYSVKLKDGTVLKECWPNAYTMHDMETGVIYKPEDIDKIAMILI